MTSLAIDPSTDHASGTAFADMAKTGVHHFGPVVDPVASARLLEAVKGTREFDHRLFLSREEFDADPQYKGVNPRPGRNLLEPLDSLLGFVEQNVSISGYLSQLLGPDYAIIDKKLVAGVPHSSVPDWVVKRIAGNAVNNLGAYVRPEYRDMTYFYGIDFHQDLIDWENRTSDFITLYVYLHDVTPKDAPLYVIPGSHLMGATRFPHKLTKAENAAPGAITYTDDNGRTMDLHHQMLVGPAGSAYLWHALMLHGTQPDRADHERISMRYLIARGDAPVGSVGIDRVNAAVDGSLSLATTREDLAIDGAARLKFNAINALAQSGETDR